MFMIELRGPLYLHHQMSFSVISYPIRQSDRLSDVLPSQADLDVRSASQLEGGDSEDVFAFHIPSLYTCPSLDHVRQPRSHLCRAFALCRQARPPVSPSPEVLKR